MAHPGQHPLPVVGQFQAMPKTPSLKKSLCSKISKTIYWVDSPTPGSKTGFHIYTQLWYKTLIHVPRAWQSIIKLQ